MSVATWGDPTTTWGSAGWSWSGRRLTPVPPVPPVVVAPAPTGLLESSGRTGGYAVPVQWADSASAIADSDEAAGIIRRRKLAVALAAAVMMSPDEEVLL